MIVSGHPSIPVLRKPAARLFKKDQTLSIYLHNCDILPTGKTLTRSHRLPGNRDDEFKILKYHDKTPVLAGCEHCRVKFFAPSEKMKDIESAEKYLREKYLLHDCERAQ